MFGIDEQGREVNLMGPEIEGSPIREKNEIVGMRAKYSLHTDDGAGSWVIIKGDNCEIRPSRIECEGERHS